MRARNTLAGLYEHHYELHDMMEIVEKNIAAHKDDMGELLAPYYSYAPEYKECCTTIRNPSDFS